MLHAQPSIFQPDTDMQVTALASHEVAKQSQKKSLKPGDWVIVTGVLRVDTLTFPTGEVQTIHHIALTKVPQMVVKETV